MKKILIISLFLLLAGCFKFLHLGDVQNITNRVYSNYFLTKPIYADITLKVKDFPLQKKINIPESSRQKFVKIFCKKSKGNFLTINIKLFLWEKHNILIPLRSFPAILDKNDLLNKVKKYDTLAKMEIAFYFFMKNKNTYNFTTGYKTLKSICDKYGIKYRFVKGLSLKTFHPICWFQFYYNETWWDIDLKESYYEDSFFFFGNIKNYYMEVSYTKNFCSDITLPEVFGLSKNSQIEVVSKNLENIKIY